jgi:hypothetical protein
MERQHHSGVRGAAIPNWQMMRQLPANRHCQVSLQHCCLLAVELVIEKVQQQEQAGLTLHNPLQPAQRSASCNPNY